MDKIKKIANVVGNASIQKELNELHTTSYPDCVEISLRSHLAKVCLVRYNAYIRPPGYNGPPRLNMKDVERRPEMGPPRISINRMSKTFHIDIDSLVELVCMHNRNVLPNPQKRKKDPQLSGNEVSIVELPKQTIQNNKKSIHKLANDITEELILYMCNEINRTDGTELDYGIFTPRDSTSCIKYIIEKKLHEYTIIPKKE